MAHAGNRSHPLLAGVSPCIRISSRMFMRRTWIRWKQGRIGNSSRLVSSFHGSLVRVLFFFYISFWQEKENDTVRAIIGQCLTCPIVSRSCWSPLHLQRKNLIFTASTSGRSTMFHRPCCLASPLRAASHAHLSRYGLIAQRNGNLCISRPFKSTYHDFFFQLIDRDIGARSGAVWIRGLWHLPPVLLCRWQAGCRICSRHSSALRLLWLFYYDPSLSSLSLGRYSTLREIALVQEIKAMPGFDAMEYYTMGHYVSSAPKTHYKATYHPSYLLDPVRTSVLQ